MKINELFKIKLDDIYWSLKFGMPKIKADIYDLRRDGFESIVRPVFFLSTGRCGTMWFSGLLGRDSNMRVFHEPRPNLGYQGRIAYETIAGSDFMISDEQRRLLEEIFLAGREQYLRYACKSRKRYVETNNQITFFAPVIHSLMPQALFVHVYRHPGEYVRSAMRRKYFTGENREDIKRVNPLKNSGYYAKWQEFSQLQKIAWLWLETNLFIEKCKSIIPAENFLSFNFNELSEENIIRMVEFTGAHVKNSFIRKSLEKRKNVQRAGTYRSYDEWPTGEKEELKKICGNLAAQYGYRL